MYLWQYWATSMVAFPNKFPIHLFQKAAKKLQKQINCLSMSPNNFAYKLQRVANPRFHSSTSEQTVEAPESHEELDELVLQASQQYAS